MFRKVKQIHKHASKYKFAITLNEIRLHVTKVWQPHKLLVTLTRKKKKITGNPQSWHPSVEDPYRGTVKWSGRFQEVVEIIATLLEKSSGTLNFESKSWVFVLENEARDGKRKPIATARVDLAKQVTHVPNTQFLELPMKPVAGKLISAKLTISVICTLISVGPMNEADLASVAESAASDDTVRLGDIDVGNLQDLDEHCYWYLDQPNCESKSKDLETVEETSLQFSTLACQIESLKTDVDCFSSSLSNAEEKSLTDCLQDDFIAGQPENHVSNNFQVMGQVSYTKVNQNLKGSSNAVMVFDKSACSKLIYDIEEKEGEDDVFSANVDRLLDELPKDNNDDCIPITAVISTATCKARAVSGDVNEILPNISDNTSSNKFSKSNIVSSSFAETVLTRSPSLAVERQFHSLKSDENAEKHETVEISMNQNLTEHSGSESEICEDSNNDFINPSDFSFSRKSEEFSRGELGTLIVSQKDNNVIMPTKENWVCSTPYATILTSVDERQYVCQKTDKHVMQLQTDGIQLHSESELPTTVPEICEDLDNDSGNPFINQSIFCFSPNPKDYSEKDHDTSTSSQKVNNVIMSTKEAWVCSTPCVEISTGALCSRDSALDSGSLSDEDNDLQNSFVVPDIKENLYMNKDTQDVVGSPITNLSSQTGEVFITPKTAIEQVDMEQTIAKLLKASSERSRKEKTSQLIETARIEVVKDKNPYTISSTQPDVSKRAQQLIQATRNMLDMSKNTENAFSCASDGSAHESPSEDLETIVDEKKQSRFNAHPFVNEVTISDAANKTLASQHFSETANNLNMKKPSLRSCSDDDIHTHGCNTIHENAEGSAVVQCFSKLTLIQSQDSPDNNENKVDSATQQEMLTIVPNAAVYSLSPAREGKSFLNSNEVEETVVNPTANDVLKEEMALTAELTTVEERSVEVQTAVQQLQSLGPAASKKVEKELMQEWFQLVHKKNSILRQQDILALKKEEQVMLKMVEDVHRELMPLMFMEDSMKTLAQKERETKLLEEKVRLVNKRDEIMQEMNEKEQTALDEDERLQTNLGQNMAQALQKEDKCSIM
ncbi:uncharacterized protein LOC143445278 isoform X3 [Clavelina lepadiformis]|uniref:uncharacterized protein LOC143445278 isoform X3 n=1 Tax=Clavelina lepadiformis TaxID=159417 RepID=UPI004041E697